MNGRVLEMPIDLWVVEDGERVPARLDYNPDLPFEVRLVFLDRSQTDGEPRSWTVGRDLLFDAVAGCHAGEMDVQMWQPCPMGREIAIWLHPYTGDEVLLSAPWAEVRAFVRFTEMLVPIGSEKVDVDAVILGCLTDGGG